MTAQANGNSRSDGPMSKEEFVTEALKVIQVRSPSSLRHRIQVGQALQAFFSDGTELIATLRLCSPVGPPLQKPSSLMQLYGRYLERYEEANE